MKRFLQFIRERQWALYPPAMQDLLALAQRFDAAEGSRTMVAVHAAKARTAAPVGSVAVIAVQGPLSNAADFFADFFGFSTYQGIAAQLRGALADPAVTAILLNVDSPGGEVIGCQELAADILAARDVKPVSAIVSGMAASAAYWIASQAGDVWALPSSLVGSIGVYSMHVDYSAALEKEGIKVTYIQAGKYKTEGNWDEPLSADALAHEQELVDSFYDDFVRAIAAGRKTSLKSVKADMGEGRILRAEPAKASNMVDRIGTMNDALARLGVKGNAQRAEA
jgi:signal peptide peptidase SppA